MVPGTTEADAGARVDDAADDGVETAHLEDVEDGCGCAEVWEHMSERRAED